MPNFSIIIPTYNSASTLQRCLDSIVSQTYTNFEILIIDGVSKDNTLDIAKNFKDDRIKILSEPDKGIYDAMNKGIKMAKGEWLYFLGSDDELFDNNVLSEIHNTSTITKCKIIYGNVKIKGNAGWANDEDIYDGEFTLKKILEKNICHQAIFYNKFIFYKFGKYNINYKICADYDFNLKCWSKYNFHYVDKVISIFKGGNFSSSLLDENFSSEIWRNISNYFKFKLLKHEFIIYTNQIKSACNNPISLSIINLRNIINKLKKIIKATKSLISNSIK